jgi:hypothetical protein
MSNYWVYIIETFDEEPGYRTEHVEMARQDAGTLTKLAKHYSEKWGHSRIRITEHSFTQRVITYVPIEE